MGKQTKRYNWKSRQIVKTIIDESEQKKINMEIGEVGHQYDECNALVLPSKKRKTKKVKSKGDAPVKLLSKKQRKQLQKISQRKLLKKKKDEIIEALSEVQASSKDLSHLTSLQSVQTMGRKKFLNPDFAHGSDPSSKNVSTKPRKTKWKSSDPADKQSIRAKPNKNCRVVQSESSSSDEQSSSGEEVIDEGEGEDIKEINVSETLDNSVNTVPKETEKSIEIDIEEDSQKEAKQLSLSTSISDNVTSSTDNHTSTNSRRQVQFLNRDPDIQKARLKLPILSEEHLIMETINENLITIIVGQTGSGKTTQVPQFLYEAGYASAGQMIAVTEPRRVAAVQMSERVGYEMSLPPSQVSYQIRYDGNATEKTKIKFMTDGVLFRELKKDHFLRDYSVIVIDEAHERSVHSDILIGLLSRIAPKRTKRGDPLKLVIMSATLRVEDFTENKNLFVGFVPPVIRIEPRMFNVTIYFNKETDSDYCSAAYRKVCRIHRQLPEGGILVFLTGQQEIKELCRHLRRTFPVNKAGVDKSKHCTFKRRIEEKKEKGASRKRKKEVNVPDIDIKSYLNSPPEISDVLNEDPIDVTQEISKDASFLGEEQPLWVLPLYAMLPRHEQKLVFEGAPEGTRLCVVATNVAETSLTIPNVKYVVDSGKTKQKVYDQLTGVSSYCVTWTSKASANQRAGRAGRTSDGFCYRLYSSAVFNDEFSDYPFPDIQLRPLDDIVLSMKALKVPVLNFPFPTPPPPENVSRSIQRLIILGALRDSPERSKSLLRRNSGKMDTCRISSLGKYMASLPVSPRFAKMILCSLDLEGILPYVVLIIAVLTVQELLVEIPLNGKNLTDLQKQWIAHRVRWSGSGAAHLLGDILVLVSAVLEAEASDPTYDWCQKRGIRHAALVEVRKLRRQLTNEINVLIPEANLVLDPQMKCPSHQQAFAIAEVLIKGSLDQVARRVEPSEFEDEEKRKAWKNAYRTVYSDEPAFISLASCLRTQKPKYVMYQDIYNSTKIFLRCVSVVDERWLLQSEGGLADLSPPLDVPKPSFSAALEKVMCWRKGTFGPNKWQLSECEVEYPICPDLFKWVAYFLVAGKFWSALENYTQYCYDPNIITSQISLRFRRERDNLINALMKKNIICPRNLLDAWRSEPDYLRNEYLAWFQNKEKATELSHHWPPIIEDHNWTI